MWIFIIMTHPYPQGDKRTPEFNRIFLNYIKDKPFYIIDRRTGKPVPNMPDLVGDSLSGLYYVGDLMGGNFIFDANARVIIRYEMIRNGRNFFCEFCIKKRIETAIDNFESGVWVLREWYHNGLTYSDVVKNLNTVQDFNPFSELNESEEWFESEEDYTKYFVVGQKFRFNSRSGDAGTFYGQIVKVNRDYVWITPPSLAKMSRGTRFSKERILGLLVNGDWTPVKTPIKESTELRKVIEPGMSIYCHTDVHEYKADKWYTIYDVDYNAGSNGEDLIKISNPEDEYATEANWTIQKDENDLNYENWFTFGDTEFDTNKAFDSLYESEEGNDLAWAQELYDNADEIVTSKNAFKGAKVIRGKDWDFGNQDEGSVYGIIQQGSKISRDDFTIIENDNGLRMEDYTQNGPDDYYQIWVNVNWVNEDGQITDNNTYRVGPDKFDLKFFID